MKRNLSIILCLAMLFALLAGCAGAVKPTELTTDPPASADDEPVTTTPTPPTEVKTEVPDPVQIHTGSAEPLDVATLRAATKAFDTTLWKGKTDRLPTVGSLSELVRIFDDMGLFYAGGTPEEGGYYASDDIVYAEPEMAVSEAAEAPAAADMATTVAAGNSADSHSTTNIQVEGVDEADIIKTDGQYIYWSSNGQIAIIRADGLNSQQVALISSGDYASNMFLCGDRLVTVSSRYEYDENAECRWWWGKEYTCYTVYDISDPANPTEARRVEVEGSPLDTRLIGNNLYFVCSRWLYSLNTDGEISEYDLLPCYVDTAAGDEALVVPAEDIYYCPGTLDSSYMLVGAFDVTGDTPCVPESILGAGNTVYMNTEHLYVARCNYNWEEQSGETYTTDLYRFSVDGASLRYDGTANVNGTVLNQYAMDETGGFFRIATTSYDQNWNESNNLYILDGALAPAGSITGIAPDETIQSVRFSGDTAYVVTYEQTDPLFVIDLSDPYAPVIRGELKIPGFSSYLHPLGDGLLLGVGRHTTELYSRDANGVETVEGTIDKGMKLSLFDVSDPANPIELYTRVLGSGWNTSSELDYNPRALFADAAKGIYGVPVNSYSDYTDGEFYGYVLFRADRGGIELLSDLGDGEYYRWSSRLIYIGDTLYLLSNDRMDVYNYADYSRLGVVQLQFNEVENYPVIICD